MQKGEWRALIAFLNELHVDHLVLEMAHRPAEELAPLRDVDARIKIGLGVVDVKMGVADEANVAHANAVPRELVLDHVLVELQTTHAQRFHDLVGAIARVDHDRVGAADDQKAQRQHAAGAAAVTPEHQKARFQLDIAVVQDLDFQRHLFPPDSSSF